MPKIGGTHTNYPRDRPMTEIATFTFDGITEFLPLEEAQRKAYALVSQGYTQILEWGKSRTRITIYKEENGSHS